MEDDKNPNEQPIEEVEEVVDQPSVEPEEVEEEPIEEEPDDPVEEPEQPSRRESLRIQKLIEKLKDPQRQNTPPQHQGLNYGEALDADPEVVKQLEADRKAYADQSYNQGLQQAQSIQFHTRLEIDAPKVVAKYSQLNPEDKEHFNPHLADAISMMYLSTAGFDFSTGIATNSNVRYSEFVDSIFELGNEIAGQKVQTTAKNIARQAATTGIRPDGSSSKRLNLNQPVESMSDEELAAYGKQIGLATVKHR